MGVVDYAIKNPLGPTPGNFTGNAKVDSAKSGTAGFPGIFYQPPAPKATSSTAKPTAKAASTPAVDPYAAYGGKAAYDRLVSGFDTQKNNIFSTALESAGNSGINLKNNILDFIDSLKTGQQNIDERAVQNELAKRQGISSTYGMVGRGVRSGAVTLANRNAGDSSAADQIARAYGDIGRRQLTDVGSKYALEGHNIGIAQNQFNLQEASGVRKLQGSKQTIINSIVSDARNKLASLDASMAGANLPQSIDIQKERDRVKAQVVAKLQSLDKLLGGASKIKAHTIDQNQAEAAKLALAGVAPDNAFNFSTAIPAQFQGTGPFASGLPLFLAPSKKKE